MRRWTVGFRLLAASWVLVALMLPLAGLVLHWAFASAVTTAFDQRLEAVLNALAASVEKDVDGRLTLDRSVGDARFEQVFSGWYWQIADADGAVLVSRSLWDEALPLSGRDAEEELRAGRALGPRDEALRLVEREVRIAGEGDPVRLMVAGPQEELSGQIASFRHILVAALSGLAVVLLGLLAVQVRWGLAPLRRLDAELREVQSGAREWLDEARPGELGLVATAMNAVLERDRQLMERARSAAGNLAHSIKTPLSVLRARLDHLPEAEQQRLAREIQRIDDAVRHHLARASAAGTASFAGRVHVAEALRPVVDALARLAERRGVALDLEVDPVLRAGVDAQDLQELVGNLVENAIRWAQGRVEVRSLTAEADLILIVEDDGPGMTPEQRDAAMERGEGLDETRSGSGLGLHIVRELVELYGGRMELGVAASGGLAVRIAIPQPVDT